MTDEKLIAAVAKKAGWRKHLPGHGQKTPVSWIDKKGMPHHAEHLPSVDACLELLDKGEHLEITWWIDKEWTVDYGGDICRSDKSLPRAILEAWLEA